MYCSLVLPSRIKPLVLFTVGMPFLSASLLGFRLPNAWPQSKCYSLHLLSTVRLVVLWGVSVGSRKGIDRSGHQLTGEEGPTVRSKSKPSGRLGVLRVVQGQGGA